MSERGQQDATSGMSEFNAQAFMIYQMLGRLNTAKLVKVLSVTNEGAVGPVGYVDIQPLVNQLDGNNNAVPYAPIYGVPYFRLQGGADAVIIDPKVGDIGMAAFADRDISNVKKTKEISTPGSFRRMSLSDALYLGGFLNGTPEQYVRFFAGGIELVSPTKIRAAAPVIEFAATESINMTAPEITLNEVSIDASGNVDTPGSVTSGEIVLGTHDHDVVGIETGPSTVVSQGPNP